MVAPEKEILRAGMKTSSLDKEASWIQNLYQKNGALTLRGGFGLLSKIDTGNTAGLMGIKTSIRPPEDMPATLASGQKYGYKKHLGSHLIKTDFGHEQIVSIFTATVMSGNCDVGENNKYVASRVGEYFFADIYDITTDTHWEEIIIRPTSEDEGNNFLAMPDRRPHFYTKLQIDTQTHVYPGTVTSVYFAEYQDTLFFGNNEMGVYVYSPTIFKKKRRQQADTFWRVDASKDYRGESSRITKLRFNDGVNTGTYTYLRGKELATADAITVLGNRMVYAVDRSIYFSDVNNPAGVIANNVLFVPSQEPISAIQEINGNLLIFTESETYIYMPTLMTGGIISGGRVIQISKSIGCLGPNAVKKMGNQVICVDRNGIYLTNGTSSISSISADIKPFFQDFLTNPFTAFYYQDGDRTNTNTGNFARKNYDAFDNLDGLSLSFDTANDLMIVSIPKLNIMFVSVSGGWYVWNVETVAQAGVEGTADPIVTKRIQNPWVVSSETDSYLVGSLLENHITNQTIMGGSDSGYANIPQHNSLNEQYYILRWKKGGALDFTQSNMWEDESDYVGEWQENWLYTNDPEPEFPRIGALVFEKPIRLPYNSRMPSAWRTDDPTGRHNRTADQVVLVPVSVYLYAATLANQNAYEPERIRFAFRYDSDQWEPLQQDGNFTDPGVGALEIGELIYLLPNERRACTTLYHGTPNTGVGMAAANQIQAYSADNAGPFVVGFAGAGNTWSLINVDGTLNSPTVDTMAGEARSTLTPLTDRMHNLPFGQRNLLFYIPFKKINNFAATPATQNSWNLGIGIGQDIINPIQRPQISSVGNEHFNLDVLTWKEMSKLGFQNPIENTDAKTFAGFNINAQPIDWIYKSEQIGLTDSEQVKARGTYNIIKSTGTGERGFFDFWYGLFNTLCASDWKGWTSQFIDYGQANAAMPTAVQLGDAEATDIQRVDNVAPIRTRIRDTAGTDVPIVFSDPAAPVVPNATWGVAGNAWQGSYLIDDQEVDIIATSDSVKGKSISYMLFGFANNIASKLSLISSKVSLRRAGGRRRKGR